MPEVLPLKVLDAPPRREFLARHLDSPCIIKNVRLPWRAFKKWTPAFFAERFGRELVPVQESSGAVGRMRLETFLRGLSRVPRGGPLYLKNLVLTLPPYRPLLRDFSDPPYFKETLTNALPVSQRPDWTWLYWGGAGSYSTLHLDVFKSSAWNVALFGRKRWTFVLGAKARLLPLQGTLLSIDGESLRSPLSRRDVRSALRGARICQGVAGPGDIVYTPSGVLHQAINETESMAITRNFVSRHFLDEFLSALEKSKARRGGGDVQA